jgi:acetate kinase
MGFSPLEGLMMTTRSGSVDPGLLLHLQTHRGVGADELREVLTARSGLLGVSGISRDLRQVLDAADRGSPRARLAYDRFVLSVRRGLGAMAGVLGGVDAVVFTGGIGENSARVRRDTVGALGISADGLADRAGDRVADDRDIARRDAPVRVLVVRSREDLAVFEDVLRLIAPE